MCIYFSAPPRTKHALSPAISKSMCCSKTQLPVKPIWSGETVPSLTTTFPMLQIFFAYHDILMSNKSMDTSLFLHHLYFQGFFFSFSSGSCCKLLFLVFKSMVLLSFQWQKSHLLLFFDPKTSPVVTSILLPHQWLFWLQDVSTSLYLAHSFHIQPIGTQLRTLVIKCLGRALCGAYALFSRSSAAGKNDLHGYMSHSLM